ncbi:chalcone isomerase family protein [Flammeovirga kamogawensis]|uniref:Chalcone isomerase family protein n=1 Tax=Flammeovirga kamogawensis TaxID=373891 RepID=A0ABX8H4Q9_9BACT|nr:chalcone isomerase family protein [Flammeovirga kamogawensis]MBB6461772.1 hypothetical protein [Flammeovirga kamogawensis]QWG10688.1 chalcone isomerase family protein [Flammeovirga kamogawensis]TRX63791.1 hypothetical protein EO216_25600 [Flammeovirga kamogawensis]
MKNLITTIVILLNTLAVYSQEQTYNVNFFKNVEFPNVITIEYENLKLNGHGMHTEGISKLFVCGLYVYERTDDPIKIIYDDHMKMIEMVITSNQFQSDKSIKEIKKVHEKNLDHIKSGQLDDMVDNIKKYEGIIPQNLISTDKSFRTYFKQANKGKILENEEQIQLFLATFDEVIKIGDHIRITFLENKILVSRNGEHKSEIEGKEFQKIVLNTFIGNHAFNQTLKGDLLKSNL